MNENTIKDRFSECEKIIEVIRGTIIDSELAKKIMKLSDGGFNVSERRMSPNYSIVRMQRQYDNENAGNVYFFIVKGKLGKKLHMNR